MIDDFTDVRCPRCNCLLFRVRGMAEVEIICRRCKGKMILTCISISGIDDEETPEETKEIVVSDELHRL